MSTEESQLIKQWRRCSLEGPPYLFPGDEFLVNEFSRHVNQFRSFDEYIESDTFGSKSDHCLHLGLLPIPYAGNLKNASIFILMLNPGLSPNDYYAEQSSDDFRSALVRNLRQENANDEYPFMFLDPRFSWNAGFDYWHGKFATIATGVARQSRISYQSALRRLAQTVCCLELVPYHSPRYGLPSDILKRLASAAAIREYIHSVVVRKAQSRSAVVIVTRSVQYWGLQEQDGVVVYTGPETRAAHLTLKSRGGKAIAKHLGLHIDG